MRQFGGCIAGLAAFYFLTLSVSATTPLDELERELKDVKQQHEDANSQAFNSFFSAIDGGGQSPDAAMNLYQQAGGLMPVPTAVTTLYASETPDEKAVRIAKDQDNAGHLGNLVQVHCEMMHYAALFVVKPDTKGLKDDFNGWLKKVATIYPELKSTENLKGLAPPADPNDPNAPKTGGGGAGGGGGKRKQKGDGGGGDLRPIGDWKSITMNDSIISKYLGFQSWDSKEQGQWAVKDIPKLYRDDVLDPLRATPTADTLAAWDTYIALRQADVHDQDKWAKNEYPALQFERDSDDFAILPSTEKLEILVNIIKANPTHSKADDWLSRVKTMMEGYRAQKAGATASSVPTPSAPSADPNVTVTTQGDMTIITTTNTNAAPTAPPPPAP